MRAKSEQYQGNWKRDHRFLASATHVCMCWASLVMPQTSVHDLGTYHLNTWGWLAQHYGDNPLSVILHTHMRCRSKESVVTVPLPGSFSDWSTHVVISCTCDFTRMCVAETGKHVYCRKGCCCDLAACRVFAHIFGSPDTTDTEPSQNMYRQAT